MDKRTINAEAFAYVVICDLLPLRSRCQPPCLTIDWESVGSTPEAVRAYAEEWHTDEPGLIVALSVRAVEVERYPGPFSIRGEEVEEVPEQRSLFG